MWRLLENRVLKTRFISLYITKQQHQQKLAKMKSEPEGKKKEKKMKTKKKPRKNQTPRRTSGHATQAAWAPGRASLAIHRLRETWGSREPSYATWVVRAWPRDSGCATWVSRPGSCDSGRMTWVVRPGSHDLGREMQAARPGPRELFLSLSDLVSLPLIWFDSFSLSDLILFGEVRLHLRLKVFKIFLVYKSSLRDSILKWSLRGKRWHIRCD